MIRLFIAIDLTGNKKKELENFTKASNIPQSKITEAEKMHITIKFLGYVEDNILDDIDKSLKKIASRQKIFDLRLDKLGAFPSKRRGRIFWLGGKENQDATKLASDIDSILEPLGFKKEKRVLKIHLTLARIKTLIDLTRFTEQKIKPFKQKIRQITLYESKLSPKGAQYKALKKYLLKKA